MELLSTRWKLVVLLGLILVAGFGGVNIANYYVSSNSVRDALINNELPLTSNNIYSEIQAGLLRPIYISSLMANDTFLKDWMLHGEQDLEKVKKYLSEIKQRYHVSSTFVVSAQTRNYYHFDGILKQVSPKVPKDEWFFSMETHPKNYRVDVDYNEARRNTLTIFVNHKISDYDGNFLGVTGLGLDVVSVAEMIERYMEDYKRNIYFIDKQGYIKGHQDESMIEGINIHSVAGMDDVAQKLLNSESGLLRYDDGGDTILLSYRFIPELDWYLMVEQPESEALRPIRHAFYYNLGISAAITLFVLFISGYTVNLFHRRLESLARTDKLTGLINRHYFDVVFEHILQTSQRHDRPVSLAVFDIDNLKYINDHNGHLEGDRVIASVAAIASNMVRQSDIVSRWGGDEFTVLFVDCDREKSLELMESIRRHVEEAVFCGVDSDGVTVSAGVAQNHPDDSVETLLFRADKRLYEAKRKGRNRVVAEG